MRTCGGGKVYTTKLRYSKEGVEEAKTLLRDRFRRQMGIQPERPAQEVLTISTAHRTYMAMRSANRARKTLELDWYAYNSVVCKRNYGVSLDEIQSDIARYHERTDIQLSTKHIVLRAFLVFCGWLHRQELITRMPRRSEVLVTPPPRRIEIFTAEEIQRLLAYFETRDKECGLAISFAVLVGARLHEIIECRRQDITDHGTLVFTAKSGKTVEEVPLTKAVSEIIDQLPKNREKLFRFRSQSQMRRLLDEGLEATGIEKRHRSWHAFRRTMMSRLVSSNVDSAIASRVARCGIQTMLKHYLHFSIPTLAENLERAQAQFPTTY